MPRSSTMARGSASSANTAAKTSLACLDEMVSDACSSTSCTARAGVSGESASASPGLALIQAVTSLMTRFATGFASFAASTPSVAMHASKKSDVERCSTRWRASYADSPNCSQKRCALSSGSSGSLARTHATNSSERS